jgi:hypothetical protein
LSLGSVGVDVNCQARVAVAVCTGERDELSIGRGEASSARDLDLSTFRVDLLQSRCQDTSKIKQSTTRTAGRECSAIVSNRMR